MSKKNLTKRIKLAAWAGGGVFVAVMWLRGRAGDEPGGSSPVESAATVLSDSVPWVLGLSTVAAGTVGLWWWLRRSTPAATVRRRMKRANRRGGLATTWQVLTQGGRWMVIRKAPRVRPSVADLPLRQRLTVAPTRVATTLVTVKTRVGPLKVYSTHEDWELNVAPPRSGKTGKACNDITDAPGAVVATSTRVDIYTKSIMSRRDGRPNLVLNPDQLGGGHLRSTLAWDIVQGCKDPMVAMARGGALASGVKGQKIGEGNTAFWQGQSVRILSLLLEAAAIAGERVTVLPEWIAGRESRYVQDMVAEILSDSVAADQARHDWRQFVGTNTATATSTTTTISAATQWLRSPEAAQLALPESGEGFNVRTFVREEGTLYLLAQDREFGTVAPFFAALAGHIMDEAVQLASASPSGRLDPVLSLVGDELASICPLPIDRYSAILGGSGIIGRLYIQGRDQLYDKWGERGGNVIWNNCTSKAFFGGCDNPDDLEWVSRLIGDISVPRLGNDGKATGDMITRRAIPPEHIRMMDEGEAVVLRSRMPATIGRVPWVWDRPGYRELPLIPDPRLALEAAPDRKALPAAEDDVTSEGDW